MKFLSVELEGIRAYDDKVVVDLSRTSPEENVLLIWGRNGRGKTSFLDSMKLLFTGIADPKYREVGFPPKPLSEPLYVMGDGGQWEGLINRQTRLRAQASGTIATARVKATWEADGRVIIGERSWTSDGTSSHEFVVVTDGDTRLANDEADERLGEFLPKEFVNFFFFDGEDIKSLAERSERQPIDFDRLLRISFVNDLTIELEKVASERQRQNLKDDVLQEIAENEAALVRARRAKESAEQQLARINDILVADLAEMRRLTRRRENLSSGASEAIRADLEARRVQLREGLDEAAAATSQRLPAVAPLLVNLGLLRQAYNALDLRLQTAGAAEAVLIRRVKTSLPRWLARVDGLAPSTTAAIQAVIDQELDDLVVQPPSSGPLGAIDLGRAERLRNDLMGWLTAGDDLRAAQAANLAEIHRLQTELHDTEDALRRIEVGSESNLEEYTRVVAAITVIEERDAELNQTKGAQTQRLEDAVVEIEKRTNRLKLLEGSQQQATKNDEEARAIRRVITTLKELLDAFREATREEVQDLINDKLQKLIKDHPLIHRVELDDDYTMSYRDEAGHRIGRSSLSSGLKQLAATALLWAMKDSAGHHIPVIVDTPLGRIDRENQVMLLTNYYPALSHQVIVLPTDSEIDQRKLGILYPRIADQWVIQNETGDRADIQRGQMWDAP
jgi:DNA sulfur modification protein DndD